MIHTENKQNVYITLLPKELDIIQDTIKNLDDIIYKTKNFAFLAWGGSLYLFSEHFVKVRESYRVWLFGLTAIIPLMFWVMDFRWRKHLLKSSEREKLSPDLSTATNLSFGKEEKNCHTTNYFLCTIRSVSFIIKRPLEKLARKM